MVNINHNQPLLHVVYKITVQRKKKEKPQCLMLNIFRDQFTSEGMQLFLSSLMVY